MNIAIKREFEDWVEEEVRSGRYRSRAEVVEEALREKMQRDEAAYVEDIRERLRQAEDDIRNGRLTVADDAFFERKKQMIRDRFMTPDS